MAEDQESQDKSQKTEEATARKLEQAREKGKIPLSREVNHWMVMLAILLIISILGQKTMHRVGEILKPLFVSSQFRFEETKEIAGTLSTIFSEVLKASSMLFLALLVAGIAAGLAQTQFLVSAEPLKPKFEKISPLNGLKRIFSSASLMEFFKGLFKMAIVGAVLFTILYPELSHINYWGMLPISQMFPVVQQVLIKMLIVMLAIMALIAGVDYLYQRYNYKKQMRMSKQDIKEEHKESEGDPLIKRRLAQIRRERSQGQRISTAVPDASVVIMNPTHYAVALKYDDETMDAPVCVAKGLDLIAQRIRSLAEEYDIPIIEDPPLARLLYAAVEVDEFIPDKYYFAVARVVRFITGLDRHYRSVNLEDEAS